MRAARPNNFGGIKAVVSRAKQERGIMVDQEVFGSQLKTDRFPFPSDGDVTLAVRNADYTLGPVMLHVGSRRGYSGTCPQGDGRGALCG